jgi:hypothetical protein
MKGAASGRFAWPSLARAFGVVAPLFGGPVCKGMTEPVRFNVEDDRTATCAAKPPPAVAGPY